MHSAHYLYLFGSLFSLASPWTLAQTASAPPESNLRIRCDLPAHLEIDGADAGLLEPGVWKQLLLPPGEHQLQAKPQSGSGLWKRTLLVSSALPTQLDIPLRAALLRDEVTRLGYWHDSRTNLIWAAADSGSGVTVSQARSFCRNLSAGGFQDWRLPEINELQTLFGGPADERGFRVVAPLKLTGWSWSATQGQEPAENWTLDLGDGARASVAAGDAGLNRALCVRQPSLR
ncbi:MAG: DUF1566 domain-containing protein [Acidobacteria bacterium]|nr:DUF1566 domain-containing protein [Acidobacteriota bacterium]